jgi:hypothetical protein
MRFKKIIAGSALSILVPGAALMAATGAQASTAGCNAGGAFTGYCSAQVDQDTTPLAFNVSGATYKTGQAILGWKNDRNYANNDFTAILFNGNNSGEKEFIATPNGVPAVYQGHNLCIAINGFNAGLHGKLALEPCNGTSKQLWSSNDNEGNSNVEWVSAFDHTVITANGQGGLLTSNAPDSNTTRTNQHWTFDNTVKS